ncbi:hypothetical protein [Rhodopseudomonas sp. BR0G17]|uniref:hypothetical protein n=1 Tax=Rhodopseudomonas sp. BR0G17 TaxID=2269368 RepID=UPI0013E043D2|nr:hypothetical protein [Rhodopseudomonas sp. BR0G17]NEW96915.1 hypothetical protein [Rhodopseudomonas sp. BR0G17]
MADETKSYRITAARPIGGRMRKPGETVALTDREYQSEVGWGGLELIEAEPAASKSDPEVEQRLAAIDNPDQSETTEPPAAKKGRR